MDRWVGCSSWWSQDGTRTSRRPDEEKNCKPRWHLVVSRAATQRLQVGSVSETIGLSSPPSKTSEVKSFLRSIWESAEHFTLETPAGTAVTSAILTTSTLFVYWRYFRRLKNAEYITPRELRLRRIITGKVTSVGDADGFRMYHQPGPPLLRSLLYRPPTSPKGLKDQTLSVRLAGADAPESAHFGKTEQPFAKEARAELSRLIEGKTVRCEVAHIDQYKRLVATPYVWQAPYIFGRTNVSLALIKAGLATVYRQGGASYGSATFLRKVLFNAKNGMSRLERAEKVAQRKKIGIWSLGKKFETPEDYKRRTKGVQHA
ncbi:unnamed protein product [Sympodiomycopsis kandeliae]